MGKSHYFHFSQSAHASSSSIKKMTLKKALSVVKNDKLGLTRLHIENRNLKQLMDEIDLSQILIFHVNVYFKGYTTIMEINIHNNI